MDIEKILMFALVLVVLIFGFYKLLSDRVEEV
jgi:hypothetical protein